MGGVIIRVDDVSPNTDMAELNDVARILRDELGAKVIYGINLFAKATKLGSVYPDLPMRGREFSYFCDVDRLFDPYIPRFVKVASHGLIHAEHGKLSYETQQFSILVSCSYLRTKTFIPPFMSFNDDTRKICAENGIELIEGSGWGNMEKEEYDGNHKQWYFHPWRMKLKDIRKWVNASKVNV